MLSRVFESIYVRNWALDLELLAYYAVCALVGLWQGLMFFG